MAKRENSLFKWNSPEEVTEVLEVQGRIEKTLYVVCGAGMLFAALVYFLLHGLLG